MLIEIHMLQNHAPSNLNRDDTGSPKQCVFGCHTRSRISSQCLKRSIRRSRQFREALEDGGLARRTRRLPELVRQKLLDAGLDEELAAVAAVKATGFGTKEGKENDRNRTAQTMFLTDADIESVAGVLKTAAEQAGTAKKFEKTKAADLQKMGELAEYRPITVDVALFGRMTTSPAFVDVDAACQVAHALSTNKMDHEFDYYTAVDDLQRDAGDDAAGADMMGDIEYNSACYYKYFSIDCDALITNLAGPDADEQRMADAADTAREAIAAMIRAAVFTTPSGKQNSFAAHQLPDVVFVEARTQKTPVSYANAFVKPVRPWGDHDLVDASILAMTTHVAQLTNKFGLQADPRLWFCTRDLPAPEGTTLVDALDDLIAGIMTACQEGSHA